MTNGFIVSMLDRVPMIRCPPVVTPPLSSPLLSLLSLPPVHAVATRTATAISAASLFDVRIGPLPQPARRPIHALLRDGIVAGRVRHVETEALRRFFR